MTDKKQIWVVDDSVTMRKSVMNALKGGDYDFVQFETADAALEKLDELQSSGAKLPDLIITDYFTKSNDNGMAVVRRAKELEIKSIMVSAESIFAPQAIELGALGFFDKDPETNIALGPFVKRIFDKDISHSEHSQDAPPIYIGSRLPTIPI